MHDLAVLQAQCPVEVEIRRRNRLVFAQTSRSRREICRSLGPLGAATLKLPGPSAYHPSYRRSTVRSVDSTIRSGEELPRESERRQFTVSTPLGRTAGAARRGLAPLELRSSALRSQFCDPAGAPAERLLRTRSRRLFRHRPAPGRNFLPAAYGLTAASPQPARRRTPASRGTGRSALRAYPPRCRPAPAGQRGGGAVRRRRSPVAMPM